MVVKLQYIGQLHFCNELDKEGHEIPRVIDQLLKSFQEIFIEPQGLPPKREQDHQILLKPGAEPVSVKPYRYPHFQKSEIEKLVRDMLQQGIIRNSTSPFASLILLVKKKDGGWTLH